MRRLFTMLLATDIAVATGCAGISSENAATFSAEDSAAVRASIDKWVKGTLERDYALFGQSMTPDVILYPGNAAPVRGREAALAFVKTYPPMSTFVVNVAELTGSGDAAYDHGTYTATVQLPNGGVAHDTGSFSTIFQRQSDGSWAHHRVIFHSNLAPAVPATAPARR